jgi:hypothetical protein
MLNELFWRGIIRSNSSSGPDSYGGILDELGKMRFRGCCGVWDGFGS